MENEPRYKIDVWFEDAEGCWGYVVSFGGAVCYNSWKQSEYEWATDASSDEQCDAVMDDAVAFVHSVRLGANVKRAFLHRVGVPVP